MAPKDDESTFAQTLREGGLHPLRFLVRHRIEVCVKLWHQALAMLADNSRRFDARLVILKSDFRGQPGHADVVAGLPVAVRIAQIDHIDRVMALSFPA